MKPTPEVPTWLENTMLGMVIGGTVVGTAGIEEDQKPLSIRFLQALTQKPSPEKAMALIIRNSDSMFTVFSVDDDYFMTVVAGGVALYDITIRLSKDEIDDFERNSIKPIALAKDVANRTLAYADRIVSPSIDSK